MEKIGIGIGIGIIIVFIIMIAASLSKVPAGNVGILVNLYGSDKGVSEQVLPVGKYWVGFGEELYVFPTFMQNYVWTAGNTEGSPNDESFTFQTRDGMTVNADIGISYSIKEDKVVQIFQTYRRGVNEITDTFLRNQVRDALVSVASTKPIEYVYGEGKAELMKEVETIVREQNKDLITISQVYWIGELRLPEKVRDSINDKVQATQKAVMRENEIQEEKANAQKAIEKATGKAEAITRTARAEANAIRLKGDAEADAIKAKSAALNASPQLVNYEAASRWDGKLPEYMMGNSVPMISLPTK